MTRIHSRVLFGALVISAAAWWQWFLEQSISPVHSEVTLMEPWHWPSISVSLTVWNYNHHIPLLNGIMQSYQPFLRSTQWLPQHL